MGCVLWITCDGDPAPMVLRAGWECEVKHWRAGETGSTGRPHDDSGILVEVSDADFDDLGGQVADATQFLTEKVELLRVLMSDPGVQGGVLDFGIAQHDRPAYWRMFPAPLIELAGRAGLGIKVSLYAVAGVSGVDEPNG